MFTHVTLTNKQTLVYLAGTWRFTPYSFLFVFHHTSCHHSQLFTWNSVTPIVWGTFDLKPIFSTFSLTPLPIHVLLYRLPLFAKCFGMLSCFCRILTASFKLSSTQFPILANFWIFKKYQSTFKYVLPLILFSYLQILVLYLLVF